MSILWRSWLRVCVRLTGLVLVNILLMAAYALSFGPARRWRRPLQRIWCRALCRLAGLRLRVSGVPDNEGPTLFVANHCSYLDIPVISREADGAFVAKAEVARWPLFGQAARLTRTIFIHRVGVEAKEQGRRLLERLVGGDNLVLFPEGTSTDGARVAPFKSSLFSIVGDRPARAGSDPTVDPVVQPVSITYARAWDGTPLVGARRALYCWYTDETMLPHLIRMLGLPGCEVELRFLPPLETAGVGRKELARLAHAAVAASVAEVNAALASELAAPLSPERTPEAQVPVRRGFSA